MKRTRERALTRTRFPSAGTVPRYRRAPLLVASCIAMERLCQLGAPAAAQHATARLRSSTCRAAPRRAPRCCGRLAPLSAAAHAAPEPPAPSAAALPRRSALALAARRVPPPPPVHRAAHARAPRSAPLVLAALTAGSARAAALPGVLELTPTNFEASLAGRRVLVEMYAPWCPYCAKLEPLWAALPAELARTPGAPRLRHRTRPA